MVRKSNGYIFYKQTKPILKACLNVFMLPWKRHTRKLSYQKLLTCMLPFLSTKRIKGKIHCKWNKGVKNWITLLLIPLKSYIHHVYDNHLWAYTVTNLFEKHVLLFCPHSSSQLLPVMRVTIVRNSLISYLSSETLSQHYWKFLLEWYSAIHQGQTIEKMFRKALLCWYLAQY